MNAVERFEIGQFELLRPASCKERLIAQKRELATDPPDGYRYPLGRLPCSPPAARLPRRQCSGQALEAAARGLSGIHA